MQDVMENSVTEFSPEITEPECESTECVAEDCEPVETEPSSSYELDDEIEQLRESHPEVVSQNVGADPKRYSELRAMGLSMKEAFLATSERIRPANNKRHLTDSMPKGAKSPASAMTKREIELARILFDGMSDEQIKKLYNKVKV